MEAPPVIAPVRHRFPWLLAGVVVVAMGGIVLFQFNPAHYNFYPRCFFYMTTGMYCPGCGAQRALHQLFHGHLMTALRYNAPVILSLPFLAVFLTRYALLWAAGKSLPQVVIRPVWIKLLVGALILFTILRNIPVPPFTYLSPP